MITEMKDIFELATGATTLIKEVLKLKNNKKEADEDNLNKVSRGNSAKIGSSGNSAKIGSSGNYAKIGSSGYSAKIGSSGDYAQIGSSGYYAKIGSSGYSAKIGSSGYYAKIGSSGDSAKIGSSGDYAQIGSSGYYAKIGSSGNYAKIGSSGYSAKIGSSGDYAQIGSSGYYAKIGSSGYSAKIGSSGYYAKIGSSGDYAQIGSSGDYAQIGSSGDYAQIGSSGDSAQIGSSGYSAQIGSSGYSAQIESSGNYSVIAGLGYKNIIKAKKGSWITLAEYDKNGKPICVKSAQIDGEILKEDTFYCIYNSEFKEVQIIDDVTTIIEKRKQNVIKGRFLDNYEECYVVEQDGIYSHGSTLKEAKESLIYKISNRDTSFYNDYTLDTEITKEEAIKMYRVITGACEAGTRHFCETHKIPKKMTVRKAIELTQGQYNCEKLKEFFGGK